MKIEEMKTMRTGDRVLFNCQIYTLGKPPALEIKERNGNIYYMFNFLQQDTKKYLGCDIKDAQRA
jgi:hypothetical protein